MISEFSQGGVPAPGSPFNMANNSLFPAGGIAIEPVTGNVWFTAGQLVGELTSAGTPVSGSPFVVAPNNQQPESTAIALDSSHYIWTLSEGMSGLSKLASNSSPVSGSPFFVFDGPARNAISIDGGGNVWMPGNGYVIQFGNTGSLLTTFSTSSTINSITVDGSGNVWAPNSTSVTEYIGASVPVVTPLVAGVINNTLGTRP
jgi:hypothetical protein